MNVLNAVVTEVMSDPYEAYGKWWVKVAYDCWGIISQSSVMLDSYDEAAAVSKGYQFLT